MGPQLSVPTSMPVACSARGPLVPLPDREEPVGLLTARGNGLGRCRAALSCAKHVTRVVLPEASATVPRFFTWPGRVLRVPATTRRKSLWASRGLGMDSRCTASLCRGHTWESLWAPLCDCLLTCRLSVRVSLVHRGLWPRRHYDLLWRGCGVFGLEAKLDTAGVWSAPGWPPGL